VSYFHAELEELRLVMGKPKPDGVVLSVKNAAPREVYFQAESMFAKINRLSFQLLHQDFPELEPPEEEIVPGDVLRVVMEAGRVLDAILTHFEIDRPDRPAPDAVEKTPTDVFHLINRANRQINLLLDKPVLPSDVFQEVTYCVNHVIALRAQFPGRRIPEEPEFFPRKEPEDVYQMLWDCFTIVDNVAELSGLRVLDLNGTFERTGVRVVPSDVYDFASLLVSELRYFHSQLNEENQPRRSHYPGRKFPSHVHQRARLLQAQLTELRGLVETTPNWLGAK